MREQKELPDLAEFQALSKNIGKKRRCPLAEPLTKLPVEQRKQLAAALAADKLDISAGAVAEWCRARGHDLTYHQVKSHRGGTCSCHERD